MERPKGDIQPKQRPVTGEVMYLDEMRRQKTYPKAFLELSDMAIQMYETEAGILTERGIRPDIMDEFERHDGESTEVVASCFALAEELLKLKEANSMFTYADIIVEADARDVLERLRGMTAGNLLQPDDAQLAIESNGEYYPVLDMRKQDSTLTGVGLRVWGWDDQKSVFTNKEGEVYNYQEHVLVYPSDEKSSTRQIELTFGYNNQATGRFSESVSLRVGNDGRASMSSNVWAIVYAETGYEGHKGVSERDITDEDIAAFGDLIAEIVGDAPESVAMRIDRNLEALTHSAATEAGRLAVARLVEVTWPAQAEYMLRLKPEGSQVSIAELLRDESTAGNAVEGIGKLIDDWTARTRAAS